MLHVSFLFLHESYTTVCNVFNLEAAFIDFLKMKSLNKETKTFEGIWEAQKTIMPTDVE
ncbi:hypothetical protein BH10BAC1_BH10BAC1_03720 [soil metagenome]